MEVVGQMAAHGVAIIGGGPAGCSAALACAARGIPAVLFEKHAPNRDKPCGDALIPNALAHLQRFGLGSEALCAMGGWRFGAIRFGRAGANAPGPVRPQPGGVVLRRAVLDQRLRDVVSRWCEVRYGAAVTDLVPISSGIVVEIRRAMAGVVGGTFGAAIIATGAASRLSARYDLDGAPLRGVAIRGYRQGGRQADSLLFELTDHPVIEYRWTFPTAVGANIGACRLGDSPIATKRSAASALRSLTYGLGVADIAGGVEPLWSGAGGPWHHAAGIVSCGDAAGLVNPTTGEGITAALISGEMAGRAAAAFVRGGGVAPLEQFSSDILTTLSERYSISNSLVEARSRLA